MRIPLAICALAAAVSSSGDGIARASDEGLPFTVDLMLSNEEIDRVLFTDDGMKIIYERKLPYYQVNNFLARPQWSRWNSKIFVADLNIPDSSRPLFSQRADQAYSLMGISRSGLVAYSSFSEGGETIGVTSVDGHRNASFKAQFAGSDLTALNGLPFAGEGRIVFPGLPLGAPSYAPQSISYDNSARQRGIEDVRRGKVPTVISIGSGRFKSTPGISKVLYIGDGNTGELDVLERGSVNVEAVSPDGDAVLALLEKKGVPTTSRLHYDQSGSSVQRAPFIREIESGRRLSVCETCDVAVGSTVWSKDGQAVAFIARDVGTTWESSKAYIYRKGAATAKAVPLPGLSPVKSTGDQSDHYAIAWLGNELAILLKVVTPSGETQDWYSVSGNELRNITRAIPRGSLDLVAQTDGSLIVMSQGSAWGARLNGDAKRLSPTGIQFDPWVASPLNGARDSSVAALRGERNGRDMILFVALDGSKSTEVIAPNAEAKIVAVSPEHRKVAFLDRSTGSTKLYVLSEQGQRRDITEINRHLIGVTGGVPVRVDHTGPDGAERHSWLLVPKGARPNDRIPTIVMVYPPISLGKSWPYGIDTVMNTAGGEAGALLAAHGYAVLYPDVPDQVNQPVPRKPLSGLAKDVEHVIDVAASKGYIDPTRLAVQGWSYGGYSAAALMGMSDRFITGVAGAGIYDLLSHYGSFMHSDRTDGDRLGLQLASPASMESGVFGIGSPPWTDPSDYLANSPLMKVATINKPIMLIHGDADSVAISQAEEMFTALARLNKDSVFLRYVGEGHGLSSPANLRDMWSRIFRWYKDTLGEPMALPSSENAEMGGSIHKAPPASKRVSPETRRTAR